MIPSPFWKMFKEFGASCKKGDGNDCLQTKAGDSVISNDFDLAENYKCSVKP